MSELTPNPEIRNAQLFEHLFPGNKWSELPKLTGGTIWSFVKGLLPVPDSNDPGPNMQAFGNAQERGQGYAYRVEVPKPDKFLLGLIMSEINPINEGSTGQRGWFSDLVKQGERLGGMGVVQVSWLPTSEGQSAVVNVLTNTRKTAEAQVVGVLSPEGRPTGLIYYAKGPRPGKGKRVTSVMRPELQPVALR